MDSQLVPIANKLSRSQSRNLHSPHSPEKHSKIGGPGLVREASTAGGP